MTGQDKYELSNIDPEEISDVLLKVEKSFNFKFGTTDLKDVKTFGELCDIIAGKVQGDNLNDCTTQQAFYKVRNTVAETLLINKGIITPGTNLLNLLPRNIRRKSIKAIDSKLGFKTNILRPNHFITGIIALILIASFVGLFVYWQAGVIGLAVSITCLKLATKFANEIDLLTVRQFVEKISREQYLKSRRSTKTINKSEIELKVKELFKHDLSLDEAVLTRQATFD
jgi:hypothetical protein